jgi:hypothetical protein
MPGSVASGTLCIKGTLFVFKGLIISVRYMFVLTNATHFRRSTMCCVSHSEVQSAYTAIMSASLRVCLVAGWVGEIIRNKTGNFLQPLRTPANNCCMPANLTKFIHICVQCVPVLIVFVRIHANVFLGERR